MTSDEALQTFGLPASPQHRDEIRQLLAGEIEREKRGESAEELLRTLCVQLFSLGIVDDALLLWDAKRSSFDSSCGLDVQFICGAGLAITREFLARDDKHPTLGHHLAAPRQFEPWLAIVRYFR